MPDNPFVTKSVITEKTVLLATGKSNLKQTEKEILVKMTLHANLSLVHSNMGVNFTKPFETEHTFQF